MEGFVYVILLVYLSFLHLRIIANEKAYKDINHDLRCLKANFDLIRPNLIDDSLSKSEFTDALREVKESLQHELTKEKRRGSNAVYEL